MSFLYNIRLKFFKSALMNKVKGLKISRTPSNFERSRTFGVVFDMTNPQNEKAVREYAEQLRKEGKTVDLLAYVDDSARHNNYEFKHFNRKDLDWILQPKIAMVTDFVKKPFDVLMCLYSSEVLPLDYVSALSHANLRVGKHQEGKNYCFDLMVDIGNTTDLRQVIQQMDYMLKVVNKN